MINPRVRVRFAPSPTGPLHMGGVRTALYNYLFAKKQGGDFILRIEDTDQNRFVPGAEEYIKESLEWCGLQPDEGPDSGGEYGPYRQSERKELYREYADRLVESGNAYFAFDTQEEIEKLRLEAEGKKEIFSYGISTRSGLNNSLTLTPEQVREKIEKGDSYVIRFKMPEDENITANDLIRGQITFNTSKGLDDKVLFKSDGMPTYHLANVVDDYLMKITHVIRGEEWISSLPLHILLYRAFGWEESMPQFAHLPLILKPQGKGKLSKRDGDKMGFPVFPLRWSDPLTNEIFRGYREDGYFPSAFVNMLALLGWNPGTEQEFFTMEELIDAFTLERVVKSGSRFDPEKAKWFNRHYFQQTDNSELSRQFLRLLEEKGITSDLNTVLKVVDEIKERCAFVEDLWEQGFFFFRAPESYDEKAVRKRWKEETPEILKAVFSQLSSIENWSAEVIKADFSQFISNNGWSFGKVMPAIRICMIGDNIGPDLFLIFEIIGRDETLARIDTALKELS